MSGLIGGAGSKSGVIGDLGGVSSSTTFFLTTAHTTDATVITGWSDPLSETNQQGHVGARASHSSGVFTMPSAGTYLILGQFTINHVAADTYAVIDLCTGDGSTKLHSTIAGTADTSSVKIFPSPMSFVADVPNPTSVFCFKTSSFTTSTALRQRGWWDANVTTTNVSFIKLGN